jgi:hypothetical protein
MEWVCVSLQLYRDFVDGISGAADMSQKVYRHLIEQRWRNEGALDLLVATRFLSVVISVNQITIDGTSLPDACHSRHPSCASTHCRPPRGLSGGTTKKCRSSCEGKEKDCARRSGRVLVERTGICEYQGCICVSIDSVAFRRAALPSSTQPYSIQSRGSTPCLWLTLVSSLSFCQF